MNTDRVGYSGLFVVALYGMISSFLMPLGQLREPGPGFLPLCLSTILVILAGVGVISSRPSQEDLARTEPFWGNMKSPVKIVVTTGLAIWAFEPVGFLVTSVCFLGLLFRWVSDYPWWKAVLLGVCIGGAGWFFFAKLLGVSMPGGFLGW